MNPTQAAFLCLVLAFPMSNLPFAGRSGSTAIRILWWLILYGAWIAATVALERISGIQAPKDWSLWPISIAFFAVLAFPSIVYRYLWRS